MSHFYGKLFGTRKNPATTRGHKSTPVLSQCAGWGGAVETEVYYDEETDKDMFVVRMVSWKGQGDHAVLVRGEIGDASSVMYNPEAV